MTISRGERLRNIDLALRQIVAKVGDAAISFILLDAGQEEFCDILSTTWGDMESRGWVHESNSTFGHRRYRLTGSGWLEGLQRTGQLDQVRPLLIRLRRAAKSVVKGRQGDEAVFLHEFALRANLPKEFIDNVIESRLLDVFFPNDEMGLDWWSYEDRGIAVRVPARFGMKRL